jgi:two-component system, NarL family, nitrate/nitrite response regulator NarL
VSRPKVLVADGLAIFRAGVRNVLRRDGEFRVTEAVHLQELQDMLAASPPPEVALIDADLPPIGGVAAVEWLDAQSCVRTIVWSFEPTREGVIAALRAGASGYLRKDISPDGLVRSLRGLARGEAPLSRDLVTLMIEAIHHFRGCEETSDLLSRLSSREYEVLEYIARGARNRQIASELTISEFTVKRHVHNILDKLEVCSRREAGDFYHVAEIERASVGQRQ